jgi:hypothetical protein
MHIVLLNTNPVISRLLLLCTDETTSTLQEVSAIEAIGDENCDILLIDDSLYTKEMLDVLRALPNTKKVLLSYQGDEVEGFDTTIKKPFLPLQIMSIIKEIQSQKEKVFDIKMPPNILSFQDIEQIKTLLEVDSTLLADAYLSDESVEIDKMKVITEELIAEGVQNDKESKVLKDFIQIDEDMLQEEKIERAIQVAIQQLSKKKLKKFKEGKEIKMRIQLKDNDLC